MLQTTPMTLDSRLPFWRGRETIDGIVGVQVDDTIRASTSSFSNEEDVSSRQLSKLKEKEAAIKIDGDDLLKATVLNELITIQRIYIKNREKYNYGLTLSF